MPMIDAATHCAGPLAATRPFGVAATIALTLALAGCASLSPEQCRHADWRQIGYADGAKGLSGAQIDEHAQACAPQGIRPNLDEYLRGRAQGLVSYCQAENGFQVGRRGDKHIAGDCPQNLKWAFLDQYNRGSQVHAIESDLSSRRSDLYQHQKKIRKNDERIGEIKTELAKNDLSPDHRNTLLNEYNDLVEQKQALGRKTLSLEEQVEHLQRRLYQKLKELGR